MTTYFVDTSVAVPLVLARHVAHRRTNEAAGRRRLHLAGHAIAETYSVLTRLPGDARLSPEDASVILRERFASASLSTATAMSDAVHRLARAGIAGGAVYDGLVALAVLEHPRGVLLSRDLRATATYTRLGVAVELVADR